MTTRNQNREQILESIIAASPLAIFDLDRDGRVLHIWNRAAEEMFGWRQEEVLGRRLPIVPDEKQKEFDDIRERSFEGEVSSGIEVVRQRKDGSPVQISISTAPIRNGDGKVTGIMSVLADIGERKHMEEALLQREKRFREIFNNVRDAIYFHLLTEDGMPGRFVEVNQAACDMLGYSREEFLSMSAQDIDAPENSANVPKIMAELHSRKHISFEMLHLAKDGTSVPVEINSHVFAFGGQQHVVSVARDISVPREMERQLRNTLNRLKHAMRVGHLAWWEQDVETGAVQFDPGKAEMLGYSPDTFQHYSDFTRLLHPDDYGKTMQAMRDHLTGKKKRYEAEYRIRKKNGDYIWLRDAGSVTKKAGNKVTGIVIDIDSEKRASERLAHERSQLRRLHQVAHDLAEAVDKDTVRALAGRAAKEILGLSRCRVDIVENGASEPAECEEADGPPEADEDFTVSLSISMEDMGTFNIACNQPDACTENNHRLAELLAEHVHQALKRLQLENDLKEQTVRDPLTGLHNRRYMADCLQTEEERCRRYDHPLAFLMIDVNRFKEVNDRYSHQLGDRILLEVGRILEQVTRASDTVVRYGGDEFLIMMPETDLGAEQLVERIHARVQQWNQEANPLDFPLSLAIGIARWLPIEEREVSEALKDADMNMYRDKGGAGPRRGPRSDA